MKKIIVFRKGTEHVILVDEEDFKKVSQYTWHVCKINGIYYAQTTIKKIRKTLMLHRLIMDAPKGKNLDHINGNGLDNRKCNLRFATPKQNMQNRKKKKDSSCEYKGVYWKKSDRLWCARITIDGRMKQLGKFKDEIKAAKAYDKAALGLFGEFARINFPKENQNGCL